MAAELPEWVKKTIGQEQTVGMRNGHFYLYDVEYSCDRAKIFGIKTAGTLDEIGGIIPGRRKPDAKGTIVTSFEYGATDALEVLGTDYAKASVGSLGLKMAMMPSWPWPNSVLRTKNPNQEFLMLVKLRMNPSGIQDCLCPRPVFSFAVLEFSHVSYFSRKSHHKTRERYVNWNKIQRS